MFISIKLINYLLILYYLFRVAFNSERCGAPALYKLTNFKIVNNSSNICSNLTGEYSEGTVIKYECINKNDEIIGNNNKAKGDDKLNLRTCIKGIWNEKIPHCAQSLDNKAVIKNIEVYDNMQNKTIYTSKTISHSSFSNKAYLANPYWPHDCENVTISDYKHQFLIINLNTSSSFNYFKLELSYPQVRSINMNDTVITVTPLISSKACRTVSNKKYVLSNQRVETYSVLCELSAKINSNNSITKDDKLKLLNKTSKVIRLKFDVNKSPFKVLKISICELRLFKYPIHDCGEPDKPLNSIVSISNKEFAQFTCVDGYEIHPFKPSGYHVKCDLNSEWKGQFPTCQEIKYCNLPENKTDFSPLISFDNDEFNIINGKNTTISGTIANYSCENITINGTQTQLSPISSSSRTCLKGKWSGPELECLITKDNIIFMETRHNDKDLNIIIISMGCVLLLCLIIILSFIIMFWLKRKENKKKREVVIPRSEQTFSNNNELWDHPNDDNRYDSIRMSHLSNDCYYEIVYEDVDKISVRMSNNVIYEIDAINTITNDLQTNRPSNSLWAPNSSYC